MVQRRDYFLLTKSGTRTTKPITKLSTETTGIFLKQNSYSNFWNSCGNSSHSSLVVVSYS